MGQRRKERDSASGQSKWHAFWRQSTLARPSSSAATPRPVLSSSCTDLRGAVPARDDIFRQLVVHLLLHSAGKTEIA